MVRAARKPKEMPEMVAANDGTTPGLGHNGLSDQQHKVLFHINRRDWLAAMDAKKKADAEIKRIGKVIKSDLGPHGLDEIKTYEKAQTEDGAEEIRAAIEAKRRALNLAGVPLGTQLELLVDRAPLDERAFTQGEEAGMRGESFVNPYNESTAEGDAFARGWRQGQDLVLAEMQKRMEAANAELVEGPGHDDGGDLDDDSVEGN